MGLVKAIAGSAAGVMSEQWRDYYYCDALEETVLAARGRKRISNRSSNRRGPENIITNGSVIAVADGQCMMIVEQGRIAEISAEPGEFIYDSSTEPSIFSGDLGDTTADVFRNMKKRFTFGGQAPKDQRIYYFNTKELVGNRYGTPNPIPFRVVDRNIGLDMDISITCYGEFSYRIMNPILFYQNVCGNIEADYGRVRLDDQLASELMTALQPAFARISNIGIRYSSLPAHADEIADALNEVLSEKWRKLRGLEVVSFGISGIRALPEDEKMIKELQRNAVLQDPGMAAAQLVGAQSEAMKAAAANQNAGAAMAFMGMNMASGTGGAKAENLFRMAQEEKAGGEKGKDTWTCSCGAVVNGGSFCPKCGSPRPKEEKPGKWTCSCGSVNDSNFCPVCGAKRPDPPKAVRCSRCGWESDGSVQSPRFCPQCGNRLDGNQKG